MSAESYYLKTLANGLKGYVSSVDSLEKTIIEHSLAAATAAVASGWIPGAGGMIATGIGLGFVVSMYYKICRESNIKISKNKLKAVASVVVAETAAYLGIAIAAELAMTFIPFIGNLSAAFLSGVINFGMVYVAGTLFLKMMVNVFKANGSNGDIDNMSEEDFKKAMKAVSTQDNIKKAYSESKNVYKDTKNDTGYNTDDIKPSDD